MEQTLYVVTYHFEDGPSIWVASSLDKAIDIVIRGIKEELRENPQRLNSDDIPDILELLENREWEKAVELFEDSQREEDDFQYIESFNIHPVYPVDVDKNDVTGNFV